MAKLNVKVIDMVNGEVTKIAHDGVEYAKVDGAAHGGDIGLIVSGWGDQNIGEYYRVVKQFEVAGKYCVAVPHKSGTFDSVGHREDFVIYRKSLAQSSPTIEQRVDKLEREVAELKDMTVVDEGTEIVDGVKYRKVNRAAVEGDYIKITDSDTSRYLTKGRLYEVIEVDFADDPQIIDNDGDECDAGSYEYEVYEKVGVVTPNVVEEQPLQVGDYAKVIDDRTIHGDKRSYLNIGQIVKVVEFDGSNIPYQAEKLKGAGRHWFRKESLTRATDEEVAEAKRQLTEKAESDKWAKIGREVGEFKKGDVVRVVGTDNSPDVRHTVGDIGVIERLAGNPAEYKVTSVHHMSVNWLNGEDIEIIAPVESRFDLTEGDE